MPFLFTCPHCQARTEVDDSYSGRSGECVVCGRAITLPNFDRSSRPAAAATTTSSRKKRPIAWVAAAVLMLLLVGAGLFAAIRIGGSTAARLREGRVRLSSIRNLESIATAMNAYASDHGSYPPPILKDSAGKPLHSWRVLILPYLGEEELYRRFDLSVAWDQGDNQNIGISELPSVYRHPERQGWSNETNYYLVTGPGTLFPASGPLSPRRIPDGTSKTLLVVEAELQGNNWVWTQPVDLDVTRIGGTINVNVGQDLGGLTIGGVCVATADGRGHFLQESTPPLTVQSLITPNGDEPLRDDVLD